jgi:hypothetical protein
MASHIFIINLLIFLIMLCSITIVTAVSTNMICEVTGTCVPCRNDEMGNEYCRETGKRIRIRCKDGPNEFDDYKSCSKTAEDDQLEVIIFQIVVGVIGGLAYWGVQTRKKYSMSLFDTRKQR